MTPKRIAAIALIGLITWIAVSISGVVDADERTLTIAIEEATRGNQIQIRQPPPPAPAGIYGLPYAPEGATECQEMAYYRQQFGLPTTFDAIGWRESNCKNYVTSPTDCCRGYLQLDIVLHLRDHRLGWRYRDNCGVFGISDAFGDTPGAKQRHMCAAKQLYDVLGTQPWSQTR